MKCQLKAIKFSESLSQETNSFTANIYVNNKKVGHAQNGGYGGETDVRLDRSFEAAVLSKARAWLDVLDPTPADLSISPTLSDDGRRSVFVKSTAANRAEQPPTGYLVDVVDLLLRNSLILKDMKKIKSKVSYLTKDAGFGSYTSYNMKPCELTPEFIKKVETQDGFSEWLYTLVLDVIAKKLGAIDDDSGPLCDSVEVNS